MPSKHKPIFGDRVVFANGTGVVMESVGAVVKVAVKAQRDPADRASFTESLVQSFETAKFEVRRAQPRRRDLDGEDRGVTQSSAFGRRVPRCCHLRVVGNASGRQPRPRAARRRHQMKTLVVTRHAGTVAWLASHGIEGDVVAHVGDEVPILPGDRYVGILPTQIAARLVHAGAVVDLVVLPTLRPEDRGRELTPAEMDAAGATVVRVVAIELRHAPEFTKKEA